MPNVFDMGPDTACGTNRDPALADSEKRAHAAKGTRPELPGFLALFEERVENWSPPQRLVAAMIALATDILLAVGANLLRQSWQQFICLLAFIVIAAGTLFLLATVPRWTSQRLRWWIVASSGAAVLVVSALIGVKVLRDAAPIAVDPSFRGLYEPNKERLGKAMSIGATPIQVYESFHERGTVIYAQWPSDTTEPYIMVLPTSAKTWIEFPNVYDSAWDHTYNSYSKVMFRNAGLDPPKGTAVPWSGFASYFFTDANLRKILGYLRVTPSGNLRDCLVPPSEVRAQAFEHGWIIGPLYPRVNTEARINYVLFLDGRGKEADRVAARTAPAPAVGCTTFHDTNGMRKSGPLSE